MRDPAHDRPEFGWAVVGPGSVAQRFGHALQGLPGARLAAVAGRDAERAAAYARRWEDPAAPAASGTELRALLSRDDVDAVYVATPHPFHAEAVTAALAAGKGVLCEKPLACDAATARALADAARERGLFLMEAVWTRFLPIYAQVRRWLEAGALGEVRSVQSTFALDLPFAPGDRRYNAALGGGTLLDIGLYNVHATRMVLPGVPLAGFDIRARIAAPDDAPVDVQTAVTLDFGDGRWSQFQCGFYGEADNGLRVVGTAGHLHVHGRFWEATRATLQRRGEPAWEAHEPFRINGFEYEIEEAMRCVRAGQCESGVLPPGETVAVLTLLDALRARIGLRYPFEAPRDDAPLTAA